MTYNDDLSQLLEDVVVIYFKIPSPYLTGEKFLKKSKIRIAVCVLTSKTCFFYYFVQLTNKCTIISQIMTLTHVSTLLCHPQEACNQYLAKLHKYFKCSCW